MGRTSIFDKKKPLLRIARKRIEAAGEAFGKGFAHGIHDTENEAQRISKQIGKHLHNEIKLEHGSVGSRQLYAPGTRTDAIKQEPEQAAGQIREWIQNGTFRKMIDGNPSPAGGQGTENEIQKLAREVSDYIKNQGKA